MTTLLFDGCPNAKDPMVIITSRKLHAFIWHVSFEYIFSKKINSMSTNQFGKVLTFFTNPKPCTIIEAEMQGYLETLRVSYGIQK